MKKLYMTLLGALLLNVELHAQCSEIFFSEYIEGSANNKAIEIYNPTNVTVDLTSYRIYMINNGGSANDVSFQLIGTLAPYSTFVIGNDGAAAGMKALCDTVRPYNSVAHFNGDDALVLLRGTDTIDGIGQRWVDPGTNWAVGSGSTLDYTLVRKATVKGGQTDWSKGASEWDVYSKDTYSDLGMHKCDCYVPVIPEVSFTLSTMEVNEDAGTGSVDINIVNAKAGTTAISLDILVGTAVKGTDFDANVPANISFTGPGASTQKFNFTIIDNGTPQANKTIFFKLSNPSNGAIIGADSVIEITILDNDYRVSKISGVRLQDADLNITNKGERVEVTGVVYGIDYDGNAGYSFALIDSTSAVNIFNFNDVSGYVVKEGDNITVRGEMEFYNGLTEIIADSIRYNTVGTGKLKDPMMVNKPDESTESNFIKISKIWIADTTTVWPSNGNVWVTNEMKDTFQVRIDRDAIDIVGKPVLYDTMIISGIGGQFDAIAPYNGGYQLFPRYLSDIEEWEDKSSVKNLNIISSVYPNPTTGMVTIKTVQPIQKVEVLDLTGKVVYTQSNVKNSNVNIDLSGLTKGIYFVRVNAGTTTGVERIVLK